jgi:hypothetical protein
MLRKRILVVAMLALVLALALAVPAFGSHDPNATGCARAHECAEDYALYLPAGYTLNDTPALYIWNPNLNEWATGGYYGAKALCTNDGGYWYWTDSGEYWNAC